MNAAAVKWAFSQRVAKAGDRLVLLALAYHATLQAGDAWPSVAAISQLSGLNRKQVIPALDRLERAGLIVDSGQRQGRTRQVKVYRLAWKGASQTPLKDAQLGTVKESPNLTPFPPPKEYPIGDTEEE